MRRLDEGERIVAFDCGDADLDDFIINEAPMYRDALLAVTYVMEQDGTPIAYFSLANDRVSIQDFDTNTEFNRFRRQRFVNEKRIKSYPAVKVGRFAVSESVRGEGIGSMLLDFIKAYFIIDNKTGCRFITVDAYKSAISFYEKNGFLPLQTDDDEDDAPTRLMFFDLADYKCQLKAELSKADASGSKFTENV